MARFSRMEVVVKMQETGMVPVFYNPDIDVCKKVVKACYDGGSRIFEFTNRGDFAHEVFSELNKYAIKNPRIYPPETDKCSNSLYSKRYNGLDLRLLQEKYKKKNTDC